MQIVHYKRETSLTGVLDFKQKLLTPSLVIYNGSIHFRLASVLLKTHRNNRYRMRTWSRIMSPLFLMHALT